MDLADYIDILRRRIWVIAVTALITVLAAGLASFLIPPTYSASAQLRLQTSLTGSVDYVRYDIQYTDRLINTYINIAQSKPVLDNVMQELDLDEPPNVELEAIANTELLSITVTDNDPVIASQAANLLAELLVQHNAVEQAEVSGSSASLLDRLTTAESELEQARTEYQELSSTVAQDQEHVNIARDTIVEAQQQLDLAVEQYDIALNETPQDQDRIDAAQEAINQAQADLTDARAEHEALLTEYSLNSGRLEVARQTVQLKEDTYTNMLDRYLDSNVTDENIRALGLYIVDPASVPEVPDSPNLPLVLSLGLLVGLTGGVGLAFLFERLDTNLHTVEEIEDATNLTTLGQIPRVKGQPRAAHIFERVADKETVRRFCANLISVMKERPFQTLLMTSSERGEGKSTVVANLAISMAQLERTVVIVDADLRRPNQHKVFNLPNQLGLSNVLSEQVSPLEAVQETDYRGVHLLSSGPLIANLTDHLHPSEMFRVLDELRNHYDMVLLDTPPYLAVADTAVLVPTVDEVILVVRRGKADRESLETTVQELSNLGARPIGTVVNYVRLQKAYQNYFDKVEIAEFFDVRAEDEYEDALAANLETAAASGDAARILVVEDDESVALLIKKHLSLAGYDLRVAGDGRSAIQIAKAWKPDLVLLDRMLPNVDGLEVSRQLRQNESLKSIPIIMVTALSTLEKRVEGFEAGADDYIVKPFDGTDLELRIAAQLRRRQVQTTAVDY